MIISDVGVYGHLSPSGQRDSGAMSGQLGPNPVGLLEELPPQARQKIHCVGKLHHLCPAVTNWNQQNRVT